MTGPKKSSSPAEAGSPTAPRLSPDWWLFFRKFTEKGRGVASFAPSSRFLCRKLIRGIDFDKAKVIVELGAGTGPVTKELMKRIKPHTKLIVVELEPDFCKRLRHRFPNADIVEGDACKLAELLAERGITEVDHVISGLPLPSFPPELRNSILASVSRCLHPDGSFRQITVMPLIYWKLYRRYFREVRFKLVPLNLPPAGAYICRGFRPDSPR